MNRLWRYKKLANNENVKEEKVIDDEDYNSCFQLRKTLKNSCKKLLNKGASNNKVTTEDVASVAVEEQKIIKKLREQHNQKQKAEESQKILHKYLNRILRKSSTAAHHQRLVEVQDEHHDEYVASGIYEVFGHSCTEAFSTTSVNASKQVEAEDLSSNIWYQSGLLGKFSLEMLKHQSPGSFIIHKGSQKSANFILSLRIPTISTDTTSPPTNRRSKSKNVAHFLILQSKKGYRIKGAKKFFPTISSLVTHHSVMAESLPVTLMVERNLVVKNDDDFSSIEDLKIVFTDLDEF